MAAFAGPLFAFAYTSPGKPAGYVNDFAKVLGDTSTLEGQLSSLTQSTGVEIAVATVPTLGDETVETYAVKLFKEWGIGNKDKDNGLLVLVVPTEHKVRIEVGYGLEGAVTDLQAGNIIRDVMLPAFRNNDFAGGVSGGVDALTQIIKGDSSAYSEPPEQSHGPSIGFEPIFVIIMIFFSVASRKLRKTKSWWLGGLFGSVIGFIIGLIFGFFYVGIIASVILTIFGLYFDYVVSKNPNGGGPGGFWGGGSSGGSSSSSGSSFGGFSGGSSGGGGSSGSW